MGERLDTDGDWVTALRDGHRGLARAQYAEVELLAGWFRRGAAADYRRRGRLLHSADEGTAAAMEAAAVLRMSEPAVHRGIDVGLALEGLPCTRAAFAAGDLDLDRVRVIADVTGPVTESVRAELDRRLADRGRACGPTTLRAAGRRWALALDPDSAGERRKRAVEDRDIRVRAAADGMAWLDGLLPVEAAQAVAARLASMAQRDVCAGDPRTFPQRRADALLALVDGSGRLACGCEQGTDCPKADTSGHPTRDSGGDAAVQVGVSLETLLGLRDWPGYLHGAGAIDPDLARTLARDGRWEWILAAIDAAAADTPEPDRAAGTAEQNPDTPPGRAGEPEYTAEPEEVAEPGGTPVAESTADSDTATGAGPDTATGPDAAAEPDTATGPDAAAEPDTATGSEEAAESGDAAAAVSEEIAGSEDAAGPDDPEEPVEVPASLRARSGSAARRVVEAACRAHTGAGTDAWDDPDSPAALRYTWPAGLAAWIRARDGSCRWPGCTTPAHRCDIDHTSRFDHADPTRGGRTVRDNGACLCRRHHRVKTDGENGLNGWRVRQLDTGRLEFTTPTGETIITEPMGAPDLWPVPDLHLPTPPPPPEQHGYVSDPGIFDRIPHISELEDWLDYLLDSYPPPAQAAPATRPPIADTGEPPPF